MALPVAVAGLAVALSGNTTVVSWTANPSGDAVIQYLVYRTQTAWFAPDLLATLAGTVYEDDPAMLLPGTSWYYILVARNAAGVSPPVASLVVTIP